MGSRASDFVPWHSTYHVGPEIDAFGHYTLVRTTGNAQEVVGENEIGPGYVPLEELQW